MKLYPAIDIRGGKCVRLMQGRFDQETVYFEHPYQVACLWEEKGASFLHLVDLDGACAGESVNKQAVREIVEHIHIPVELGGGVRELEQIKELLDLGVYRVIIGSRAAEDPAFVKTAVDTFGTEHIVAGIDAKNGMVSTHGWLDTGELKAADLALVMKEMGIETIIYTDIARDGMLTGPNIPQTKAIAEVSGLTVIASGGVSSLDDLAALKEAGIPGAILGKSLYEKKIDLAEAVSLFEKEEQA